jgi:hypothetical protein
VARIGWVLYLWPGLVQLRRRGSRAGLAVAVGMAVVLNLVLLGTLGWSELLAPAIRSGLWIFVGALWLGMVALTAGWDATPLGTEKPPDDNLFLEARDYYLKGSWFEAERSLKAALERNERDLDCRLLLATLLRRTGRGDEAGRELDLLERLEGSARWQSEIAAERKLLAEPPAEAEPAAGVQAA